MEITEPVILEIPQGKRRVRVELTSRADGRDLIAAITRSMERLPGDGEPAVPETVRPEKHRGHGRDGKLPVQELAARLNAMERSAVQHLLYHVNGYCPAAVLSALKSEEAGRPVYDPAPGTVVDATIADDDEDGPMDDEAELRRAEKLRDDWEPVLTGLGERIAVLSETPGPEWDGDPECDARHPELGVGCEAHRRDMHVAPGLEEGDPDITWPRWPALASVTPLPLRSDSDVIPATQVPCPEAHPSRGTMCAGKIPHPMPHVDPDGETWVTEQATAIIGGAS